MFNIYEKRNHNFDILVTDKNDTTPYFPPTFHEHIELIYLHEGTIKLNIDGEAMTITDGDLVVLFPYIVHSSEECNSKITFATFNTFLHADFTQAISSKKPVCPIMRKNELPEYFPHLLNILHEYKDSYETDPISTIAMRSCINLIISMLLNHIEMVDDVSFDHNTLAKILRYCTANYLDSSLSLESISKSLGLSVSHISRVFNKKFRCSLRDYVNVLRVNHASLLLVQTDRSITDIMYASGFINQGTFNKAFIKTRQVTPSEFRKNPISFALGTTNPVVNESRLKDINNYIIDYEHI